MKKMPPILAAFLVAATAVFAATPTNDDSGALVITSREGLAVIADDLAASYALGADIDLGGADWIPIGKDEAPFTGTFHGNGHAIRNLVCTNNPLGNSCRGLFGCARDALIEGVSVSGTVAGKQYVGGLVGRVVNGTVIRDCAASAYANGLRLFCGNDTSITGDRLSLTEVHARSAGWPSAPKRADSASMTPIATVEDFLAITNNLAGRYALTADIDLNGEDWTPIGNYGAAFTGEFYGRGHRILGFRLVTAERYAGFFGRIAGGRVSGVAVEGAVTGSYGTQSATDVGVGGFAGKIDSKSLVEGCSFDGEVANTATCNAGGFVGYTTDSPILVGEFSCILWSKGADKWIRDCIEIFEEYGWSWCYHAYREWQAWDVEKEWKGVENERDVFVPSADNPRKKALLEGLSRNR